MKKKILSLLVTGCLLFVPTTAFADDDLFDIGLPFAVILDRIDRDAQHLGVALFKLWHQLGDRAEFRRADRGEIARVAEQDGIAVADPVMQADGAFGRLGGEIGGNIVDAQRHARGPFGFLSLAR